MFLKQRDRYDLGSDLTVISLELFELCFSSPHRSPIWTNKHRRICFQKTPMMDSKIQKQKESFHVTAHLSQLCLSFHSFMFLFLSSLQNQSSSRFSMVYQDHIKCMSLSLPAFPLEIGHTHSPMKGKTKGFFFLSVALFDICDHHDQNNLHSFLFTKSQNCD